MSIEVIYEDDLDLIRVFWDEADRDAPIGLSTAGEDEAQSWLRDDEIEPFLKSIADAVGVPKPSVGVKASAVSFNEGLMRLAAVHERTVQFRYAKGKDGSIIETRRLKPSEVKEVNGNMIFLGHDPDRDDVRAYRLDRIKGDITIHAAGRFA